MAFWTHFFAISPGINKMAIFQNGIGIRNPLKWSRVPFLGYMKKFLTACPEALADGFNEANE